MYLPRRQFLQQLSGLGVVLAFDALVGCSLPTPTIVPSAPTPTPPPPKLARIGYLSSRPVADDEEETHPFQAGLRDLGYVEGQTVGVEFRGDGTLESLPGFAQELVELKPDIIVVEGDSELMAARAAAGDAVPIVMAAVGDPIGSGYVAGLAHPGGNVTGLSRMSPALSGKRLDLLKETAPGIARVGLLWNPNNLTKSAEVRESQAAARALGLTLHSLEVRNRGDIRAALEAVRGGLADALVVLGDPLIYATDRLIIDAARRGRLPTIFDEAGFVTRGGLMSYGPDPAALLRRAATYVDRILKGGKPADLPVEQPSTFVMALNLQTARSLRLTLSQAVLLQATEAVQPASSGPRIGLLDVNPMPVRPLLNQLGYVEGKNLTLEVRRSDNNLDALRDDAVDLAGLDLHCILAAGAPAAVAARRATGTVPIVAELNADPVALNLAASLDRPGGNLTGITSWTADGSAQRVALLKETLPSLERLGILWPRSDPGAALLFREAEAAAQAAGLTARSLEVAGQEDFDRALALAQRDRLQAILVVDAPFVDFYASRLIASITARGRLPSLFPRREHAKAGAFMAYETRVDDPLSTLIDQLRRIVQGGAPADIPLAQPTQGSLYVNALTGQLLRITVPDGVLGRTREVIG